MTAEGGKQEEAGKQKKWEMECLNCFVLQEDAAIAAVIDVIGAGCFVKHSGVIFEKDPIGCIQDQFVEVVNVWLCCCGRLDHPSS